MTFADTSVRSTSQISVFFADSRPVVNDLFFETMEESRDLEVLGRGTSLADVLEALEEQCPHVIMFGAGWVGASVSEFVSAVGERCPEASLLALVQREGDSDALEALAAGVLGTFTIEISNRELQRRIRSAQAKQLMLTPDFTQKTLALVAENRGLPVDAPSLTPAEADVLKFAKKGLTYAEIARKMGVSANDVKQGLLNVYRKYREASFGRHAG